MKKLHFLSRRFMQCLVRHTVRACVFAVVMCLCNACGEDDPDSPAPGTHTGEVSFTIDLPSGGGTGTSASPIVVTPGEALNMAINQKSSYTDPDGKVFTCEPVATISLSAQMDTVFAKDLAGLTNVKDGSDIKTSQSGTSPVRHTAIQKFEVGGQEITFDLGYEVYTITNSANEKVEMPYACVCPARLGAAGATEEEAQGGRAAVSVSGVSVRPLRMSRSQEITDSTAYEVSVRFNLDVEGVNTQNSQTQTLELSVNYVGIVETTTTLEDPEADLSYTWEVKSGTNSGASPFVQIPGQTMELWLQQSSSYTDGYTNKYACTPKAMIKISTPQEAIDATTLDDLKKIVETSEDVSDGTSATQVFEVCGRQINMEWSYGLGQAVEGTDIIMPYYELSPMKLKGEVVATELESPGTAESEKNFDSYELTATFVQTATAKGAPGNFPQSFDIEYVVKYTGLVEVTVVSVEYEKKLGEWKEAEYNLPVHCNMQVVRKTTYSNGKTLTETYASPNFTIGVGLGADTYDGNLHDEIVLDNGDRIIYGPYSNYQDGDYWLHTTTISVPDLSKLSTKIRNDDEGYTEVWGNSAWSSYWNMQQEGTFGDGPDHQEGWYAATVCYNRTMSLMYEDFDYYGFGIHGYVISPDFVDAFYYFDNGTIIDFAEFEPQRTYTLTTESAQVDGHPARIYKYKCDVVYNNRTFTYEIRDTVYQNK